MRRCSGFGARMRLASRVQGTPCGIVVSAVLRRRRRRPFVGGPAGDDGDIVARLARQSAMAGQPFADARRAGIVAGRGETEIAELRLQIVQIARRMCSDSIGSNGSASPRQSAVCGMNCAMPARALGTHRARIETALLPDHAGEELDRQIVLGGAPVRARGRYRRPWADCLGAAAAGCSAGFAGSSAGAAGLSAGIVGLCGRRRPAGRPCAPAAALSTIMTHPSRHPTKRAMRLNE